LRLHSNSHRQNLSPTPKDPIELHSLSFLAAGNFRRPPCAGFTCTSHLPFFVLNAGEPGMLKPAAKLPLPRMSTSAACLCTKRPAQDSEARALTNSLLHVRVCLGLLPVPCHCCAAIVRYPAPTIGL
jgi:hypothetical protein